MTDPSDVVKLAIGAAGECKDARTFAQRVFELTPVIASLLRPAPDGRENDAVTPVVTAAKLLGASVFTAEFVGFEPEESSHRLIVKLRSQTANQSETEGDGTEHLRTEPMWTPAGRAIRKIVENLAPGQKVAAHKFIEQIDAQRKVRVLVHIEALGSRPGAPRQPDPTTASSSPGAESSPPPDTVSPAVGASPEVAERFDKLNNRQRIALANLCRGRGVANFMQPADEAQTQVVMEAIAQVEQKEN